MLIEYPKNIRFGFESTWRLKNKERQKNIDDNGSYLDKTELTKNKKFMTKFAKLDQFREIDVDPYNIEIPTVKVVNKKLLLDQFTKLSKLMDEYGYIESSRSFNNNFEGGGHIHIDYTGIFTKLGYGVELNLWLKKIFNHTDETLNKLGMGSEPTSSVFFAPFSLFVHNLNTFIINNPWIPWTFNDPNDNLNAINNIINNSLNKDIVQIKKDGLMRSANLSIDIKKWAITVRPEFGTIEFRFFGMPKNADELETNIDLAMAIYKYCFDLTAKGIKLESHYKSWKDFRNISYPQATRGLRKVCKLLKIDYNKLKDTGKVNNMKIRYAFHETLIKSKDWNKLTHQILN